MGRHPPVFARRGTPSPSKYRAPGCARARVLKEGIAPKGACFLGQVVGDMSFSVRHIRGINFACRTVRHCVVAIYTKQSRYSVAYLMGRRFSLLRRLNRQKVATIRKRPLRRTRARHAHHDNNTNRAFTAIDPTPIYKSSFFFF